MSSARMVACGVLSMLCVLGACNSVLGIPEVTARNDGGALSLGDGARDPEGGHPGTPLEPDGGCDPGRKVCSSRCVSVLEPATGCSSASCAACAFEHASATCVTGECAIDRCELGFEDCNGDRKDGCEADVRSDPTNCGKCNANCPANFDCTARSCVCTTNESCGTGGVCDQGICTCSGTSCSAGATCNDLGDCAF
jgi:hypothetical protein